ncbi:M81 family metallopeptidase [Pseudaquabacterium pictum]|uniref:Microcystinase C n=1 Tax=Pseudaquabacterium pictum TaxID=2315236 RepID=A0A480AV66_9BURK|nr:M81 family metallopeptidase [Rubrivivax pictus]GCL62668.1 microcystinase C [Rubrivivax pictus]
MRVFTASLATETNTFAPMPTGLASFRDEGGYFPGGAHPAAMSMFAGPLHAARQRAQTLGWTVVEGLVAAAQPGGTTTRLAYETLRDQILADLRAALPVQMVLLGLHGAMVADGYPDCEGDLLTRVRQIVGPGVVVGAELDPHHHLSRAMLAQADLLIAFKQYPHTDILERAQELVDLCAAQVAHGRRPVPSVVDTGMAVMVHTTREPAQGFVQRLQALEGRDGVLSISLTHGFPWGDVPDMGTQVLVYTDGRPDVGDALARQLADELVALRDDLETPWLGIDAALDAALAAPPGLVVIADSADNPGGGAAGDSTFVLRRLVERGIRRAALGPLWDPQAVRIAFEAGIGARLPLRLGGKVGPLSGAPLDADCTVLALQRDMAMSALAGTTQPLGDCALVRIGGDDGVQVVLISRRSQAMGTDLFTQLGCDLAAQRIVVVKSSQHFRAAYAPLAVQVLYCAAPGTVSADLRQLPYRHIRRPRWPIDA